MCSSKKVVWLCLVLVLALVLATSASAGPITKGPYVQNVTTSGITIMWETNEQDSSKVQYGLKDAYDKTATNPVSAMIHKVRLSGLEPATQYSYRVGKRTGHFTTAPLAGAPFKFAVVGDSRVWGGGEKDRSKKYNVQDHLLKQEIALLLETGDLVANGNDYELWDKHYFPRFARIMRSIPMYPCKGNHDTHRRRNAPKNSRNWFQEYFDIPSDQPFSFFEYSDAVFINISYEDIKDSGPFIAKVLSETTKKWKFVYFHYPVYCTGYDSPRNVRKVSGAHGIAPILEKYKVDMVFNGNTHIYERCFSWKQDRRALDNSGVVYVVTGGMVGGQYPDLWTARMLAPVNWTYPQYQVVKVDGDLMTMQSFAVRRSDDKLVLNDLFMISKDPAYPLDLHKALTGMKTSDKQAVDLIVKLGALCHFPAAESIVPFLADQSLSDQTRQAAADALDKIASQNVIDQLIGYLYDRDIQVRRSVARAIARALPTGRLEKLKPVVSDPNQDIQVRMILMGGIQHANDPGTGQFFVGLVNDDPTAGRDWRDTHIGRRAAYGLKEIKAASDPAIGRTMTRLFAQTNDRHIASCLGIALSDVTGLKFDARSYIRGSHSSIEPMPDDQADRRGLAERWMARLAEGN